MERRVAIKELAAEADLRWASQKSFLDQPGKGEELQSGDRWLEPGSSVERVTPQNNTAAGEERVEAKPMLGKQDPWSKSDSTGRNGEWQPEAWSPKTAPTKR